MTMMTQEGAAAPAADNPAMFKKALPAMLLLIVGSLAAMLAPPTEAGDTKGLDTGDTAWMLTATALVLLMTPGLSFFYGGMVRPKNVISTMLQSFIAMSLVSLVWVVCGFSLAFGDSIGGVIGDPRTFFMFSGVGAAPSADLSPTIPLALFALFQLKFAIITPALITGSFAERVRFSTYIVFMVLFVLLIYCPLAHMTWHPKGLLRVWGVLDFAGGTVVHMSAGFAALVGAFVLGPRRDHAPGVAHAPANIPYVLLGTGMLWFGWFGFNAGSALGAGPTAVHAFLTTNTASAAAMFAWMLTDALRGTRPSAMGACIGAVVGLVAITPAAGFVSVGSAMALGSIAAIISNVAVKWKSKTQLDDTLDVFPCHGIGGVVGMIGTGLLSDKRVNSAGADGLLHGGTDLFKYHMMALVLVAVFVVVASFILYKLVDAISTLRVTAEQENEGLDLSQHGETL